MNFTVSIKDRDEPISVEMGRTILDAAMLAGGPFPYSCRSGNCGTCKCRLLSGEVEMSPFSEFALSADEEKRGFILACRAVPWSDCEIELADEDDQMVHPMRDMACVVKAITPLTHDIIGLRLSILSGGPFTFTPGQFADVALPDQPARSWSMASQPDDDFLEFYVRILPDGRASRYLADHLQPGDQVRVKGPSGTAALREERRGPILAIAGGSGLSPIKSIIDRAAKLGWAEPVHFYFGVRDERDLYLVDHFEGLCAAHPHFHFTPVLSAPCDAVLKAAQRRFGLVTDIVKEDLPHLSPSGTLEGFTAYLAGPPPMVEAAERLLPDLGIAPNAIHADAFYSEADLKKADLEKETI
ncbi:MULTISPECIES: 2Fe-2S iron-sulfur cluster-binding protein [unclassified Iodidimonas]|jgi:CDP-4-dehydro-6-deoxyglucose reductase/ferredoxin-NAD(P)+ reductase (naphthalene dioxygenase ferredoxin-specific)|uniref:2Fe-2S iron-sulfur cluster-binding protein n=1 Tax=unclassified Iodidimonas TaxID=2626145 RepID=UPI0024830463|nr:MULTISPECIES: 2Fe-2S iron-sulfur cluster-binding protein [unclassified Iodidimonas]